MTLTKSQLAQLSKWAKSGRLIVRPITSEEIPEWARHEFRLARTMVEMLLIGHCEILEKMEKTRIRKIASRVEGNRKAWKTRKRQAQARAAKSGQEAA